MQLRAGAGRSDEVSTLLLTPAEARAPPQLNPTTPPPPWQVGAVFVFAGGAAFAPFLRGSHWAEAAAAWRADGSARFGRLGSSLAAADWDGDGTAELIVGAPRATVAIPAAAAGGGSGRAMQAPSAGVEMPGAVFVYKVSAAL